MLRFALQFIKVILFYTFVFVASCGTLQTHFHEKGPNGEMQLFASTFLTFLVKKMFRKIRRFFLNLKIKKKDSSEYGQSETAAISNGLFFLKSHTKLRSAKNRGVRLCRIVSFVNCVFAPHGL